VIKRKGFVLKDLLSDVCTKKVKEVRYNGYDEEYKSIFIE
jgi:hypothetical protein